MLEKTLPVLPTADPPAEAEQAPQIDRVSVDDLTSLVPDRGRTPVQIGVGLCCLNWFDGRLRAGVA